MIPVYCSKCGNLINQGENFCNKCGTQILNNNYQNGFNNPTYYNNVNANYNAKEIKKFKTGRYIGFLFLGAFVLFNALTIISMFLSMNDYEVPEILTGIKIVFPILMILLGIPTVAIVGSIKNSKK